MKRATETGANPRGLAILAVTLTVLSGCDEALLSQSDTEAPDAAEDSSKTELLPSVSKASQRDVEAPEVFEVSEAGLWDGRPSLGGIWVAHPDVDQPERVVIKNAANDKTVVGALFRRERNLPGPALQVSSAAAEQLGMLAGAPAKIQVVALRRETIEETPPPAEDVVAESTEAEDVTDEASEVAETETEQPAKRKWWQKKEPAVAAAAVATGAAVAASDEAPAEPAENATETASAGTDTSAEETQEAQETETADKPAKRKWWQKKEPATAAAAGAAAAATAATVETAEATTEVASAATTPALTDAPVVAPAEKPAKRKWWQKKDPNEITETPLDPIEGAAAAIEASEPTPVAAAAAPAAASSLSKPYVQIGTFGLEVNANSAAEKVRRNGMAAEVRELKTEDKTVWRVLVGPATNRAERRAIQSDVKDLGFSDAFTVSN